MAWARSYLKGMGLLVNSQRGLWSLTEEGRVAREEQIPSLRREFVSSHRSRKNKRDDDISEGDGSTDWRENLLDAVMAMKPDGFERLAQRLLPEAGFINAT